MLYRSPPGDVATVLAFGREYQVGTDLGPPLAFWLADIAFRAAGNTMFGVYLLAQVCDVVTFWIFINWPARSSAGSRRCSRCCLPMTVAAFSSPGVEFGPLVLARPLWALLLLHSWQIDRPEPPQRVVRLVDRGRAAAADDVGRARAAAAARRICARHRRAGGAC